MLNPHCTTHPNATVRRYRTNGPNGPGVYPQCVPADGTPPHLLSWTAEPVKPTGTVLDVRIADGAATTSLLSPSELGVLCAAANGLTSIESGRHLRKGVETVKTQRHQILLKLGARNITQAVCIATGSGLLVADERPLLLRRAA
jgi:DNA-binding CsgD family transcriptional regulator